MPTWLAVLLLCLLVGAITAGALWLGRNDDPNG